MIENDERDEKMNCGLSVDERELLQEGLRDLEDTVPPRVVWQRIEAQARAEGLFASRFPEQTKWFAGAGIAAAVVLAVLNVPMPFDNDTIEQTGTTVPAYQEVATNTYDMEALNALMVESRQIERNLRALPAQPSVVRASTVATITDLEEQIAAIDYLLAHPDMELSPEQQEIYWRERVRLMNSLLQLRRAQAQRTAF